MVDKNTPWWKGARGEWLVVGQIVLMALVFFGPRNLAGWPRWSYPYDVAGTILGGLLFLAGAYLLFSGIFRLGPNLTPLPYPKDNGTLIESGAFSIVRHPLYCGGIGMALGFALLVHGWLTIVYVVILFVFFDFKSRREEAWLQAKYSNYGDYQKRVRKLIPFVY